MRNHDFDLALARLARRQHGAFHLRQVRELGGTSTMVKDRVDCGSWVRLAPRVFAIASHPSTWRRQYKAAELSVPDAAIADRAALLLHRFDGAKVLKPTLVVPYTSNVRNELAHIRRCADVRVTEVDGIRVTTVAQTLLDLLASWRLDEVERLLDDALLTGKVETADLRERAAAMAGSRRPHGAAFQALVEDRQATEWVELESHLELLLHRLLAALPAGVEVLRQATPPWWAAGQGRVDVYLPAWRLVIELDGRRWHARLEAFDTDRWRDNQAVAHGHRVLRFTHTHLTQRPDEVLDLILAAGSRSMVLAG